MSGHVTDFLQSAGVHGDLATHVSELYSRSYNITPQILKEFMLVYCSDIADNYKISLSEKVGSYCPVHIDFDLLYPRGNARRPKRSTIIDVVRIVQNVMREMIDDKNLSLERMSKILFCIVLIRPSFTVKSVGDCWGFHLHFPACVLHVSHQKNLLRSKVIEKMINEEVIYPVDHAKNRGLLNKSIDQVYDNCATTPWRMYGSVKSDNDGPYQLAFCLDENASMASIEDLFDGYDPDIADETNKDLNNDYEFCTFHAIMDFIYGEIARECYGVDSEHEGTYEEIKKEKLTFYLPIILSLARRTDYLDVAQQLSSSTSNINALQTGNGRSNANVVRRHIEDIYEDLDKAESILPCLSDARADDRSTWFEMGCILYSISCGDEKGLKLFIDFSKRCPRKYKDGECQDMWHNGKFYVGNYTIASLFAFLKEDNQDRPEVVDLIQNQMFDVKIDKMMITHFDTAELIFSLYKGVLYTDGCKKWALYHDGRLKSEEYQKEFLNKWEIAEKSTIFNQVVTQDIIPRVDNRIRRLKNEIENLKEKIKRLEQSNHSDDDESDNENSPEARLVKKLKWASGRIKHVKKIRKSLCTLSWVNSSGGMSVAKFRNIRFFSKLDENIDLLGFDNGVYDLKNLMFRSSTPNDYCTFSVGYDYKEFRHDHPAVRKVNAMLKRMFVDMDVREFILKLLALMLRGRNMLKKLTVLHGKRDNGKTLLCMLLKHALGQYLATISTNVISGKAQSSPNSASPELAKTRGVRILILNELSPKHAIQSENMKRLTGGEDGIYARDLYDSGGSFVPQFNPLATTNALVRLDEIDSAILERMLIIPCDSMFVKSGYPLDEKDQYEQRIFPRNDELPDDIRNSEMASAFLWLLLAHYLPLVRQEGLVYPDKVIEATKACRDFNDYVQQFTEAKLQLSDDPDQTIDLSTLYTTFKGWYQPLHPNQHTPIYLNFVADMRRLHSERIHGKKLYGYDIVSSAFD